MLVADLSNNNGTDLRPIVDALHAHGVRGVIFKITEGTGFIDKRAKAGIQRARHHGMIVGGYHFFHPESDPEAQAEQFVKAAHAAGLWHKGDFRPVLDYEVGSDGHESPKRDRFYARVHRLTRHHSLLYTGGGFNATGWLRAKDRHSRRWWAAGYPHYIQARGYGKPLMHQFTDRYPVGPYRVDMSRVLGVHPRVTARRKGPLRVQASSH
jgi:GH25 family lysozyme M1 (1,4-beta-N-acetylmuramidase)